VIEPVYVVPGVIGVGVPLTVIVGVPPSARRTVELAPTVSFMREKLPVASAECATVGSNVADLTAGCGRLNVRVGVVGRPRVSGDAVPPGGRLDRRPDPRSLKGDERLIQVAGM
jgi:hypothetical protein